MSSRLLRSVVTAEEVIRRDKDYLGEFINLIFYYEIARLVAGLRKKLLHNEARNLL
jgi:NADH/NAD ratio-sensing transcriptional regulator Rex